MLSRKYASFGRYEKFPLNGPRFLRNANGYKKRRCAVQMRCSIRLARFWLSQEVGQR